MRTPPEICAKCGARNVAMCEVNAKFVDDVTVTTVKNPTAVLFRGSKSAKLVGAVCETCGYVELYAENPGQLVQPTE